MLICEFTENSYKEEVKIRLLITVPWESASNSGVKRPKKLPAEPEEYIDGKI